MKYEIRESFFMTGFLAGCIACILFMVKDASGNWSFGHAGFVSALLGLAAIGVAIIRDIVDYVLDQRPWAATSDYRRLKNKTVRFLREFVTIDDHFGVPVIDEVVMVSEKQMFIMRAERLGIDQGTAERDFECEVMGRVWR